VCRECNEDLITREINEQRSVVVKDVVFAFPGGQFLSFAMLGK
jgi:hypothetical protein